MLRSMMGFGQPAETPDISMGASPPCAGFLVRLILTSTPTERWNSLTADRPGSSSKSWSGRAAAQGLGNPVRNVLPGIDAVIKTRVLHTAFTLGENFQLAAPAAIQSTLMTCAKVT
jgi:hypothetical protein